MANKTRKNNATTNTNTNEVKRMSSVESIINETKLAIPDSNYKEIIVNPKDNSETIVNKVTKTITDKNGKAEEITITGELAIVINNLDKHIFIEKMNKFQIAANVAKITDKGLLKDYSSKFKSTKEFCKKVYDMEAGNSSIYYRIGHFFMIPSGDVDEYGEPIYQIRKPLQGFGFSQVERCLDLVSEKQQKKYIEEYNKANPEKQITTLKDENLNQFVDEMLFPILNQTLLINSTMTKQQVNDKIKAFLMTEEDAEQAKKDKETKEAKKAKAKEIENFYNVFSGRIDKISAEQIVLNLHLESLHAYLDKEQSRIDETILSEILAELEKLEKSSANIEKLVIVESKTNTETE